MTSRTHFPALSRNPLALRAAAAQVALWAHLPPAERKQRRPALLRDLARRERSAGRRG